MPVYSLTSKEVIPVKQKQQLVDLFTDTHCNIMIAPEQFVHVLFSDGIPITNQHKLYIHANVRKGRPQDKIDLLVETLKIKCAEILRIPKEKVHVNLLEINAKWIMEGGHVMPDPGEEDEWMAKVTKALEEREKHSIS